MTRIWKVDVERTVAFTMVVVAPSESEARLVAQRNADDAESDYGFDSDPWYAGTPTEVTDVEDLDAEDRDLEPYGEAEGRTAEEWLRVEVDGTVEHAVPFCGGVWRLEGETRIRCDGCGVAVGASLPNLDAAWAQNEARPQGFNVGQA